MSQVLLKLMPRLAVGANDGRDGQSWYRATVLFVNLLNEPAPPADDGVLTSDFFSTEPLEFSRRNTPFSWPSWWRREESDEGRAQRKEESKRSHSKSRSTLNNSKKGKSDKRTNQCGGKSLK